MDNPERMDQTNQDSSIRSKRKRGRPPRSDEVQTQQQLNPSTSIDENLIGRRVSGVVEGCFEAGYFLNVKVADTDKQLKGIVFLPGKVTPVTPTTDIFPQAKMYAREDVLLPSFNQQTPTTQSKKDTGNQIDKLMADENQSATLPDVHPMSDEGVVSEALDETNLPMDIEMKDAGASSGEEKLIEPEGPSLSLMPQFASDDDAPKEDHTILRTEACGATSETKPTQATGSSSTLSLELFQNQKKRSGTEEEVSPKDAETRGVDDVPQELQLELGNKKMSATATATETNHDPSTSSKGGLLANLFDNREETNAGSESGFPDDNDS